LGHESTQTGRLGEHSESASVVTSGKRYLAVLNERADIAKSNWLVRLWAEHVNHRVAPHLEEFPILRCLHTIDKFCWRNIDLCGDLLKEFKEIMEFQKKNKKERIIHRYSNNIKKI
jgi:hypothetical protein